MRRFLTEATELCNGASSASKSAESHSLSPRTYRYMYVMSMPPGNCGGLDADVQRVST
jgi:hypothetical protein